MKVFEFLSRLDVCYQHQAGVVQGTAVDSSATTAPGMPQPRREPTPWARSVLAHLGRLLWMEDAGGSPKAGSTRMLEVFRDFDADCDGLLQRSEFAMAVKTLLAEYAKELPAAIAAETATDERIGELMDSIDFSGDGMVNYLEFLHAFQPVDRTPGSGLRTDLMEQICTTIWANKASLLRTLQVVEESNPASSPVSSPVANMVAPSGRVSQDNLKRILRSLNASLEAARGATHGSPLTCDQINILVDHAALDAEGHLDYQAFLDAFDIVDLGAPVEEIQPASGVPASHVSRGLARPAPAQHQPAAATPGQFTFVQHPSAPPGLGRFGGVAYMH